jgi:hypothetical protein
MSRGTFAGVEDAAVERLFECSSDGWRLWLAARIHNATQLNDGEMSDRDLLIIAVEAGLSIDQVRAAAPDLAKHHAWQQTNAGWRDPHHIDHNDSRARREERRADWRAAKTPADLGDGTKNLGDGTKNLGDDKISPDSPVMLDPAKIVPVENAPISEPETAAVPVENTPGFRAGNTPSSPLSSPLKSSPIKSSPVSAREQSPRRGDAAMQPPKGYELVDGAWVSPDGRHAWTEP